MVDVVEIFGGNAGTVWQTLKKRNLLTVKEIASRSKLKVDDVLIAIGWLGREGKIFIDDSKRTARYGLID
ncbi:MAG: hypothetical protein GXO64_00975 [Candidatus Micrarchaeota archaeon]|nr:hypothetical protein [Candidatus Micrarchaeota archaeon]